MNPLAEGVYNRISTAISKVNSLNHLSKWICKHTVLEGKQFSFKRHEYQTDIVDDQHSRKIIKKCAQVGLSELSVRITLAFLGVSRSKRAIYTLPTSRFASKFSKDRFDPVIEESPILTSMRVRAADSAEMKRLGSCTLYLNGTMGQSSAISIPAHMLIHDEKDFSDQSVISSYQSRLQHNEEDKYGFKGVTYEFSTPTVKGFGISADFEISSQKYYFVKCSKCGHNDAPDLFRDGVLPGYDNDLSAFSRSEANDPTNRISEAYIGCPKCGSDLKLDLLDPSRREWVAAKPEANRAGWQVSPFDVPHYNSIPGLFSQASNYKRIGDWHNFVLGREYEDADNTFLGDPFEKGVKSQWTLPEMGATGTFAGVDVGKISHLIIGKVVDNKPHIIWAEKIRMSGDMQLAERLSDRIKSFGISKLVIDAMPDFSTALALITITSPGVVYANYYTPNRPKNKLTNIIVKEEESVVSTYKTGVFDDLCKIHNSYGIAYPDNLEIEEVKRHLGNLKKIINSNSDTQEGAKGIWINTGEDHYGHALNYANIAKDMMDHVHTTKIVGCLPGVSRVILGSDHET